MAGMALAIGAYSLYSVGDAVVKGVAPFYPGTGIALWRYIVSTLVLGVASWRHDPRTFRSFPRPWLQIGRGGAVAVATAAFFVALGFLPLAEATVIMYLSPILIVFLSRLLLGEQVPRIAWVATILAFAGVVVVVRPDVGHMQWVALLPLVTAFAMASFVIMNRVAAGSGDILHTQFLISLSALVVSSAIALGGHLTGVERLHLSLPSLLVLLGCAAVAFTATSAHALIIMATDRISAGQIAPFTYVQLLGAVVLGTLFFGDWPDGMTLLGALLIVAAGLMTWQAQRRALSRAHRGDDDGASTIGLS